MPNTRTMQAIALIFVSISMMAAPNFAQQQNVSEPYIPGAGLIHFLQCFHSVLTIPRCPKEQIISMLNLKFELLGPECCEALLNVDYSCWPKVLPANPFFPTIIKNYCLSTLDWEVLQVYSVIAEMNFKKLQNKVVKFEETQLHFFFLLFFSLFWFPEIARKNFSKSEVMPVSSLFLPYDWIN